MSSGFYPILQQYINGLAAEFDQISEERRSLLEQLSDYCRQQRDSGKPIQLIVICTHNSRRSHMGQLWLQAAARFYGIPQVSTFSGGTEGTAFNPRSVKAMKTAGFQIAQNTFEDNPKYTVTMFPKDEGQVLFSKTYDASPNPSSNFAAIMVCTEADAGCPYIPGADQRFAIPYFDPKAFDDTPSEEEAYLTRCRQIAREMFYMMASVVGKT